MEKENRIRIGPLAGELDGYRKFLVEEEKAVSTVKQYVRDVTSFIHECDGMKLNKESILFYKEELCSRCRPSSVNTKLAAINSFLSFLGEDQLRAKPLKIQRSPFCSRERELTQAEYTRLVRTAKDMGDERLCLLMQTICATGIRVSELSFITAEAVRAGEAHISLKGKHRHILLPGQLCRKLKEYIKRKNIRSGAVFISKNGKPLDRSCIWRMMKNLCARAHVKKSRVFPHNLRHLFARSYYKKYKDISQLADLLGHSDVNTTRIYLISTGREHKERMDKLQLVY